MSKKYAKTRGLAATVEVVSIFTVSAVKALDHLHPAPKDAWYSPIVDHASEHIASYLFFGFLAYGLMEYLRHKLEISELRTQSRERLAALEAKIAKNEEDRLTERKRCAAAMLNSLRNRLIESKFESSPSVDHRFTLYREEDNQTILRIMARSCESTSGSTTSWRINQNDQAGCEGIAGAGWYCEAYFTVENLPDITQNNATEGALADYARRTYVTVDAAREHRWRARSYAAFTVRVSGRRWGVLVVDSIGATIPMRPSTILRLRKEVEDIGAVINGWLPQ